MIKLSRNIIVGITGRHNSGKDTVLSYLRLILESNDYPIPTILSLNVSAIETIAETFACDKSFIEENKNHPIVRAALEFAGNEYIPKYQNEHQTTLRLKEDIDKYSTENEGKIFLISSVYRIFEAEYIKKELGGFIISIDRKYYSDDRRDSYLPDTELMPLEVEVSKIIPDYYIRNDHSLDRLFQCTKDLLYQMMETKKWKEYL